MGEVDKVFSLWASGLSAISNEAVSIKIWDVAEISSLEWHWAKEDESDHDLDLHKQSHADTLVYTGELFEVAGDYRPR